MKVTSKLHLKLRSLIHPPLPRTPRESQQLLKALTSSFQRQLDAAHPLKPSNGDDAVATTMASSHSATATTQLLQTIMANHAFNGHTAPGGTRTTSQLHANIKSNPMGTIEREMDSGRAEAWTIKNCLKAQMAIAAEGPTDSVRDMLRNTCTGSKVAAYINGRTPEQQKSILMDDQLLSVLTPFMVAADLRHDIGVWLRRIYTGGFHGSRAESTSPVPHTGLLHSLIDAEIKVGNGLSTALTHYAKVYRFLAIEKLLNETGGVVKSPVLQAARRITRAMIRTWDSDYSRNFSVPDFDTFLESQDHLSYPTSFAQRTVSLFHPVKPNADLLLSAYQAWDHTKRTQNRSPKKRVLECCVGLRAVQVFLDQDRVSDAKFVLDYLRQYYSDELALEELRQPHLPATEMGKLDTEIIHPFELALE